MRILHVVHSLVPGEYRGGISKVAHELAAAQVRLGHQVDVFTTTLNSGLPTKLRAGRVEFDGIGCTYFDANPRAGSRSDSPTLRRALIEQGSDYDVLHGHNPCTHLSRYLAEAAQHTNRPVFHHLHGALNPYGQQSWYRFARRAAYVRLIERAALRINERLFCLSDHEAVHAERQVRGGNTMVLPNGVSLAALDPQADGLAFRREHQIGRAPLILFMGRICDLKGVHLLAEAFGQIATHVHAEARLVIAGNRAQFPDYVARLDQIIAKHRMQSRVAWTGFLDDQQKAAALAAADIFCHPSETEGMPMAVLEAMAAGLPCVIGKGCFMHQAAAAGAVVETDFTVESVLMQLRACLQSPERRQRLAHQAQAHVSRHHTWKAIARGTLDAYSQSANPSLHSPRPRVPKKNAAA